MLDQILIQFGIQPAESSTQVFGDGLINYTWKVTTPSANYILQKINHFVFKNPEFIDENLNAIKSFLDTHYPEYPFVAPLPSRFGETLVSSESGFYRLFPFIEKSHSLNTLQKKEEAYEAAKQFGKFTRLLNDFKVEQLKTSLPDFHNLSLRFNQFISACEHAAPDRKQQAKAVIDFIIDHKSIVQTYKNILENKEIPHRVIHHDTKINNVLFNSFNKGMCVIDLDTVMSGYFISDVGDMMRTYLSSANEEETDLMKINIRKDFFKAINDGYMEEMSDVLTDKEKSYFLYAGKFMILMQAIRFLTDYLQDDIYYKQQYDGHNLRRAENQMTLLKRYLEAEDELITNNTFTM